MEKIPFKNLPDTTTPINDTNLNKLQDNVENSFKNEKTTSTTDGYSCDYINNLPSKYLTTTKGQIGGSGETRDISVSNLEGNQTFLIFISGVHYDGTDNYTHATYIFRRYGTYNTLKQIDKKQLGAINLSLTYVPAENKITINNSGTYGCQYSITFM